MWSSVGRDVVGEAAVRPRVAVRGLLAQQRERDAVRRGRRRRPPSAPARTRRRRGPAATRRARSRRAAPAPRRRARFAAGSLEDRRELALHLPRVEEELPVDVVAQRRRARARRACVAGERRRRQVVERHALACSRAPPRAGGAASAPSRRTARAGAPGARGSPRRASSLRSGSSRLETTRDDARSVEDVERRLRVLRCDPHSRVLLRRRRAADQQRQVELAPLHLLRDVDHLVERRRDQAGEADDVAALLDRGVEDRVGRHHHAEVDHLVVVAAEHDADDVLADVVDVALDGGEHDLALRARRVQRLPPSRPPCTARGRPRRASSRGRSSRPAAGTSCRSRTGRRRSASRPSAGPRSRRAVARSSGAPPRCRPR